MGKYFPIPMHGVKSKGKYKNEIRNLSLLMSIIKMCKLTEPQGKKY